MVILNLIPTIYVIRNLICMYSTSSLLLFLVLQTFPILQTCLRLLLPMFRP